MDRIPLGISQLDDMIGGGAPPGSVVLLAGDIGAGAREFMYTSAVMNGVASVDGDLFELYYGGLHDRASLPDSIHYMSFTEGADTVTSEIAFTMDDELVDVGTDAVEFADLSSEYFAQSKVPTDWYTNRTESIASLSSHHDRENVLEAVGDYLDANVAGNLVAIDSVTDLVSAASDRMDWSDIVLLMKGLKKAVHRWGGMVLLLVNRETMTDRQLGRLMEAVDGTLMFGWESGGSERSRTMIVKQFRGVLSRLEEDDIVVFETELHEGGFDISDVRKIR